MSAPNAPRFAENVYASAWDSSPGFTWYGTKWRDITSSGQHDFRRWYDAQFAAVDDLNKSRHTDNNQETS